LTIVTTDHPGFPDLTVKPRIPVPLLGRVVFSTGRAFFTIDDPMHGSTNLNRIFVAKDALMTASTPTDRQDHRVGSFLSHPFEQWAYLIWR